MEYAVLAITGLAIGALLSTLFFLTACLFLLMGLIYNVPPVRAKDRAYVDVVTESINNPLRFVLGWLACVNAMFPPSSILLAYWAGGGFLMAVKRYAEYRFINDPERAGLYRKSFLSYSEKSLLLYTVFCAILSSFFLAVFLIKYRIEFILLFPFIAFMFVWYLAIGMRPLSTAQSPEKLFREKKFFLYTVFLICLTVTLAVVDIPVLNILQVPIHISGVPRN